MKKKSERKETDIKRAILKFLALAKIYAWSNPRTGIPKAGGGLIPVGLKGVSDVLGILPDGRFLAIEVKRPGKKPSQSQLAFLEKIFANNGVPCVATSVDDVHRVLVAYNVKVPKL